METKGLSKSAVNEAQWRRQFFIGGGVAVVTSLSLLAFYSVRLRSESAPLNCRNATTLLGVGLLPFGVLAASVFLLSPPQPEKLSWVEDDEISTATNPPSAVFNNYGVPKDKAWASLWCQSVQEAIINLEGQVWAPFERCSGANTEHLIELKGKEGFFPASRVAISQKRQIISEMPKSLEQCRDFYRMAFEQGSHLSLSVAKIHKSDGSLDRENRYFLEPGEALDFESEGVLYSAEAKALEDVEGAFGEEGGAVYSHRLITIRRKEAASSELPHLLHQLIPTNPTVANPITTALQVRDLIADLVEAEKIPIGEGSPIILNCVTGRDRSVKLAIVVELCDELLQYNKEQDIPWDNLPDRLKLYARRAESQITRGAGVDSIQGTIEKDSELVDHIREWWKVQQAKARRSLWSLLSTFSAALLTKTGLYGERSEDPSVR